MPASHTPESTEPAGDRPGGPGSEEGHTDEASADEGQGVRRKGAPHGEEADDGMGVLKALVEIGQALSSTLDLKKALPRVLGIAGRQDAAVSGMVILLGEQGGIELEVSSGTSASRRRVRRPRGDDIVAHAAETGQSVVVPRGGRDHGPRDRTGEGELSHVSVPLLLDGAAVGALGFAFTFRVERDLQQTVAFLEVIGSMIARAVKAQRASQSDQQRLVDENAQLRQELKDRHAFSTIVGTSSAMRDVYERMSQASRANTTVLLRGEPGTGKDLIAHAIHHNSPRAKQPFIKVSCAALPPDLVEAELFGVEEGALGGPHARRKGRVDAADGGTLFMDEIGDMNTSTQARLLRVLKDGTFERPGGTDTIRVNLRVIAASSRSLERALASGALRPDLYDRLTAATIFIPPLRERPPDLLLLADAFLEKLAREHRKPVRRISTLALDMLSSYDWPGNVRELANAIEHAVEVCDGQAIHAHDLPPTLQTAETAGASHRATLGEMLGVFEKDALQDALRSARGNRAKAARLLSTTERIFNYRVRKYGIDWQRFAR